MAALAALLGEVRGCAICAKQLLLGPRPVLQWHPATRLQSRGRGGAR